MLLRIAPRVGSFAVAAWLAVTASALGQAIAPTPSDAPPADAPVAAPSGGAPIATTDEGWTIADVQVEATAGTTLAARDAAFRDGQRKALAQLLDRMGAVGQIEPASVSDADLDSIVERFQVNAEQSSPGHYAATLTYVFRGEAVRALLAGQSPAAGAMVPTTSSTGGDLMPTTGVGGVGALNVLVPLSSPADWYDIQARLTRLGGLVNVSVASLSAREVIVEIRGGTPDTLNPILAREGLVLRQGDIVELVRLGN
jgi:hypothetical protein